MENKIEKTRNVGIEMLRLILMFMICILHILCKGGVLKSCINGSLEYNIFGLLEIIAYCAVDCFAIISGYTANNKPRKYEKIVNIWFQVFFYSFILTLLFHIVGVNEKLKFMDVIKYALPITFNKFWYMTAYFALFFSIPILNKFIFDVDKKTAKKTFIVIFALFSIIGILNDPFNTGYGYSALWLIVLYCLGALAKRIKLFEDKSTTSLILIWAICVIVTWITYAILDIGRLINYVSPTILLSSIIIVILFSRAKLKGNVVSKLSPLALGIYLFQLNDVVYYDFIANNFTFIATKNIFVGLLLIFVFASLIFAVGLFVEYIRRSIFKLLKIDIVCKKIVKLADKLLENAILMLK